MDRTRFNLRAVSGFAVAAFAGAALVCGPLKSADFEETYKRLAQGRAYSKDVQRGELEWKGFITGGVELATTVVIPGDYDPQRKYPVRIFLHGGIARPAPQESNSNNRPRRRRLECETPCIAVYPSGFMDAMWWQQVQTQNVAGVLERLERSYNVDENRVHLIGVSDGGTGVYFFGLRDATAWSVLIPLNGHLRVLPNPSTMADGEFFLSNLVNVPSYIVNGGRDPLYPVSGVQPYIDVLKQYGAPFVFRPQMLAGHDTSWWPEESPLVEKFEREHPRDPYPDRLSWQTERTDRYNRFRWLVIDKLASDRTESALQEFDAPDIRRRKSAGRVDVERTGNTVAAKTRGVGSFTLLLSPEEFDFNQPMKVVVNGQTVFDGPVKKDAAVLTRWNGRDHDRTMLFGAELRIEVPKP